MRARFLRLLSRYVVRPLWNSRTPVGLQRFVASAAGPLLKRPGSGSVRARMQARAGLLERVSEPAAGAGPCGVLYLHGGAYVVGSHRSQGALADWIAHHCRATVWLPDYRLAPEHPYPAAVTDAVNSYRDLLDRGQKPEHLFFSGDSAGGGLCFSTVVAVRDAGLPLPAGLFVFSPWVDLTLGSESIRREAHRDILLSPNWLEFGARSYAGSDPGNSGCSPLFADLSGLPPVLVQAGTDELLADDASRIGEKLREHGVKAEVEMVEGAGHVFPVYAGLDPVADRALQRVAGFVEAVIA